MSQVVLAPIDTNEKPGQFSYLPVAAGVHLYAGTLLALVTATGFVTYASDTVGEIVIGRAEYDVDNTADGVGGALSIQIKRGVFLYQNSSRSAAAYALGAGNVGQLCYVENEQTIQVLAGSTNKIVAGIFLGLDPAYGLPIVDTRVGTASGSAQGVNTLVDDSTGTAPAAVSGVVTIAAVTSSATAANAIAALIAEINALKAAI